MLIETAVEGATHQVCKTAVDWMVRHGGFIQLACIFLMIKKEPL